MPGKDARRPSTSPEHRCDSEGSWPDTGAARRRLWLIAVVVEQGVEREPRPEGYARDSVEVSRCLRGFSGDSGLSTLSARYFAFDGTPIRSGPALRDGQENQYDAARLTFDTDPANFRDARRRADFGGPARALIREVSACEGLDKRCAAFRWTRAKYTTSRCAGTGSANTTTASARTSRAERPSPHEIRHTEGLDDRGCLMGEASDWGTGKPGQATPRISPAQYPRS